MSRPRASHDFASANLPSYISRNARSRHVLMARVASSAEGGEPRTSRRALSVKHGKTSQASTADGLAQLLEREDVGRRPREFIRRDKDPAVEVVAADEYSLRGPRRVGIGERGIGGL